MNAPRTSLMEAFADAMRRKTLVRCAAAVVGHRLANGDVAPLPWVVERVSALHPDANATEVQELVTDYFADLRYRERYGGRRR